MIDWETELERIKLIKELKANPQLLHEKIQRLNEATVVLEEFLIKRERCRRILQGLLEIAKRRRGARYERNL